MSDEGRFWCLATGLAFIVIGWLSAGCVHTPSPEDPARCSVGSSVSHSRGQAAAWGETEETTVTVWGECGL